MKLTDRYVIYDDVNYIKGGWVNRNRILSNGRIVYFHVPMIGASPNRKINEVQTQISEYFLKKTYRRLSGAYKKAPFFGEVFPVLMQMMDYSTESLSEYLTTIMIQMAERLDITTDFIVSSQLASGTQLRGAERVLKICDDLDGDVYYNGIGGRTLYSFEQFRERGIRLRFVQTKEIQYQQFSEQFVPNLSIIDVLMFNGWEQTKEYLNCYRIIEEVYE